MRWKRLGCQKHAPVAPRHLSGISGRMKRSPWHVLTPVARSILGFGVDHLLEWRAPSWSFAGAFSHLWMRWKRLGCQRHAPIAPKHLSGVSGPMKPSLWHVLTPVARRILGFGVDHLLKWRASSWSFAGRFSHLRMRWKRLGCQRHAPIAPRHLSGIPGRME